MEMINVQNLTYTYVSEYNVLKNINFSLNFGEKVIIEADENSGINSLFRILLKLEKFKSGSITYKSKNIKDINFKNDINLGYISQNLVFFKNKSVFFNLKYSFKLHKQNINKLPELLTKFKLEQSILTQNVRSLTYFELLKLSILRLSIRKLEIVLIENVFKNLSDDECEEFFYLLRNNFEYEKLSIIINTNKNINSYKSNKKYLLNFGTMELIN